MTKEEVASKLSAIVEELEIIGESYRGLTPQERLALVYAQMILKKDVLPELGKT